MVNHTCWVTSEAVVMKLSLVLLLVIASVTLFKAEEVPEDIQELTNEEDTSTSFLYDGSMEDEVMGDEDDPGHIAKKQVLLRRLGARRVCGRVFIICLKKTKAKCKLVPVCKVKYFACRCIIKGVRKCKKFLHFVRILASKHRRNKHDEVEEDEEDAKRKKRKIPKFALRCKRGYRKCAKGKKFCGGCLRKFGACVRRHLIKKFCRKHGHGKRNGKKPQDEPNDEPKDDEESIMADAVENDEESDEIAEDEEEDALKPRPSKIKKKLIRCGKAGLRCMLKARLNCRRQGRCVRRLMKCVRRARRGGKQ